MCATGVARWFLLRTEIYCITSFSLSQVDKLILDGRRLMAAAAETHIRRREMRGRAELTLSEVQGLFEVALAVQLMAFLVRDGRDYFLPTSKITKQGN